MTNFDRMFDLVSGHEGDLSDNPDDPGNWTGGAIGIGRCLGTKYGISAAAYPNVDIPNLTLDDAKALYQRDYWDRIEGDRLPASLALLVFDTAINNGTERAVGWLQEITHVTRDCVLGPETLEAVDRLAATPDGLTGLCSEYLARRLVFMASLPAWKTFGLGWARRLFKLPFETLPYFAQ